ncbi:MAG: 5-(carboxyamino)imidazole ribonucleotide synthase [Limnohabitans sp.]|nr:5-(carboxyamino)imidazole ribonucleotide synthase [Limnohabitans sp.]
MSAPQTLLPGHTLGVLGGGQLGRMFVHAAQRMGYRTVVLDPDGDSPAGRASDVHLRCTYLDEEGLRTLAQQTSGITTEFENVPARALSELARTRNVSPAADAVSIAQDRALEKAHFTRCQVPVAPHAVLRSAQDLSAVPDALLPGILKTATLGYDGKGQVRVHTREELQAGWTQLQGAASQPVVCVLEQMLPLAAECSVIVARGRDGQCVNLPVQRNLHRQGILAVTEVFDGHLDPALAQQALDAARKVADGLSYVGVLCVEFFMLAPGPVRDQLGALVVNEMAPRPHNSGHYSIDACDISQFELQVRCLAGLPLTQPRQHSPSVMLNLLGDLWFTQGPTAREPDWAAVLALPGSHLHLYGKSEARVGRKMGHLTFTGADAAQVRQTALQAAAVLGIAPF